MKKIAAISIIVIAVFGIVASVSALVLPVYESASSVGVSSAAPKTYTLKEYKGQIGVFTNGSETPDSVLDVMVDTLPDYDRQSLKEGIYVSSESELTSLIEDFTS